MTKSHQRGSIIGFVVVGALLAAAVIGGIYVVKNQLNGDLFGSPEEDVATVVDEVPATEPESEQDDQAEQPAETNEESEEAATNEEAPASEEPTVNDEEEAMPTTGVETPTAEELPQTGAEDGFYVLLALGLLTGSYVAYRRSNLL